MTRKIRLSLCTALLVVGCSPGRPGIGAVPPVPAPSPAVQPADGAWVDRTLARLPLRRKVAQLMMPRIRGGFMPTGSETYDRVRRWVADEGVGGLIASVGPPLEAAVTLNSLQTQADVPLLIAADFEQGAGQIMNGGVILPYGLDNGSATRFPPAMAIGATRDEGHAYELGRITAIEGRAIGVHIAFAPVADVNNNPANPIINTRSYGADPAAVARFVAAHVRGLQDYGMLATAKHFPGHGDTHTDSHIELPVIDVTRARADSIELPPFRAAVQAGVAAVMTAHIAFPALTGDSVPATLNPAAIDGLLRRDLGFDGIVVTDAMDMGAIVRRYGVGQAAVLALKAGADIILQMPGADVSTVIDAIVEAVRAGELSEARIDRSVRRVLGAKSRVLLHRHRTVDLAAIPARVTTREHIARAETAAQRSITLVRDRDALMPLRARRILSVVYSDDTNPFAGSVFQRTLAERVAGVETARLDSTASPAQLNRITSLARDADVVVFAPFVRVTPYKAELAVAPSVAAVIRQVAQSRPVIIAAFGNPYLIGQFDAVGTYLVGWGDADVSQRAAALALAGDRPIAGSLPMPIPPDIPIGAGLIVDYGAARVSAPASPLTGSTRTARVERAGPDEAGMDSTLNARIDSIVRIALVEGAAPGAAVAVGRHGKLVHLRGYGRLDGRDGFGAVDDSTIYDLASLTKVVATTTAVMMLVDEGRLLLDVPVVRYLPEFGVSDPAKRTITVRNLLLHDAGLPAYAPLYREIRGRRAYLERIGQLPLQAPPGQRTEYSDFSAILLGLIVERVSGQDLDVFAQQRIFGLLGMRDTGFNPIWWTDAPALAENGDSDDGDGRTVRARIAPTERDDLFRLRYLQGNVHDENAYALGGVAGHAGLFSSARDLAVFAQLMLDGGEYNGARLIREETVRAFTRRASPASSRALGWDTPSGRSSAGDYFSDRSFGHTGFTGTSLWIDLERDVFLVILTNRVNPSRDNQRHVELRRDLADAVQRAILDVAVFRRPDG